MKVKKRYLIPAIAFAIWYTTMGIWMFRDRNQQIVDQSHFHARYIIKHLASTAADADEALRILKKEENEKGENPSYEFLISADPNDPTLWCVLARPYKKERYVGGISGIIFGLNLRKVRYTHTVALPSSVYQRVFGGQDPNAAVVVEYKNEEKTRMLNDTDDIFSFFVTTEGDGQIYIYPYNQIEIEPGDRING